MKIINLEKRVGQFVLQIDHLEIRRRVYPRIDRRERQWKNHPHETDYGNLVP